MRKGLLYISLPSVTSPSLQNAIDDAPRLDGADLNAPLFSGITTNSPALSSNSAATFATSPSLFKAVLKYILNYEFDISEFLELLDTLEELRIPRMTKEDNVDTFSEFRTFRAHDVTDAALGNTLGDEDHAATNTEDFTVQLTSNDLLEIAKTKDLLFVSNVTPSSFTDIFTTLVGDLLFTRITEFKENIRPLDEFSRRATQGVDDFGTVLSHAPSIAGITEFLGPEKASFQSLSNRHFNKVRSDIDLDSDGDILFIPGLPFDEDNNYGMTFNIKPLPDVLDPVSTLSSLHTSSRAVPQSLVDRINQISVVRKQPNLFPRKYWPILNNSNQQVLDDDGNPVFNRKEFWIKADEESSRKSEKTKDDDKFSVSSKTPYIFAGAQSNFVDKLLSEISLDDILPGKNPVEPLFTVSKPKKLYSTEKDDLVALKETLKSVKSDSLGEQRILSSSKTPGKKIALEFVIDETFYSIHSQLPGPIVGTPFIGSLSAVWVDLGPDYDRPRLGPLEDEEGNPLNGDGWATGTQSFYKNERYVIVENRFDNIGKFRENDTTEILPELRGTPRNSALTSHPAYTPNSLGLPTNILQNLDDIDRYDDSVKVADDAAKIWGEGGEPIGIYSGLPGFGQDARFGPAPWKWKYGFAPSDQFGANPVKRWHVEKGFYSNDSYIFTETHQASGRRINLLIREMTNNDIALSNRWNGKLQISRGLTFIDRMLATSVWKNIFRYVDSIVQLNPASHHEDEITSKDLLSTIAEETELLDRITAGFLHRFQSEQLPVSEDEDIPYDVLLKYFPGADRERALVDGFKKWPTYAGTEPANWDPKVLVKPMLNFFHHKASTKNVATFNKGKTTDTKTERVKGEEERFPHHIVKKPLYFLDSDNNSVDVSNITIVAENEPNVSDPTLSSGDIWLQGSTGKYYLFTRTFKTVLIALVPTVVVDQEFWTHVGPFEEEMHTLTGRFTATDDDPTLFNKTTVYFEFDKNLPDLDVVKSKSTKPQVFSGDALFKLDKIFGIVGVPDFDTSKQFADGAKTSEEGYFKNFTVIVVAPNVPPEGYDRDQVALDELLELAPDGIFRLMTTTVQLIDTTAASTTTYRYIFSNIFFVRSRKKSAKNILLNEVAAADSGTAFVPTYCLPSYFMETYVGEDGKFANF